SVGARLPDFDAGEAGLGRLHRGDAARRDGIGRFAQFVEREILVDHLASRSIRLANAAGSSSNERCAAAALRTASFSTSTSAAISASRLSSYPSPCNCRAMSAARRVLSSMTISSSSETKLAFGEPRQIFLGERHDLAHLQVELHADGFGAGRQHAGLGLEQEMGE